MSDNQIVLQHFILTRFNLPLWNKDKKGFKVGTRQWLEHRFYLFEKYCLPSLKNQSCQEFEWIVLFDSNTPGDYYFRIERYQKCCPQFSAVFVEPHNGCYFAEVFRREIIKRLVAKRVLTTYLDNDDALSVGFVQDVQNRALRVSDGTIINYNDGYQFYTDYKYLMQIRYPKNHFVSVVESGNPYTIKGIFGYGSHYYLDTIPNIKIENVKGQRKWCEIIHDKNMVNDAYFIGAKMVKKAETLTTDFTIDENVRYGLGIYLFRYLPRYFNTFFVRAKHHLFGRKW